MSFCELFLFTLTSSVQRTFAQGTLSTTSVVHGLPLCDMGKYCRKEKFKKLNLFLFSKIMYKLYQYWLQLYIILRIPR